mgnify:CR=1 FL=1
MHILMGIVVFSDSSTAFVSSLHLLREIFGNDHTYMLGLLLVSAGCIALQAHFPKTLWKAYALTLPQQLILSLQFWSVVGPIFSGAYPDSYVPSGGGAFIFVDQLPVLTLTLAPVVDAIVTAITRGNSDG